MTPPRLPTFCVAMPRSPPPCIARLAPANSAPFHPSHRLAPMFTPYTLALSDFALGGLVLSLVIIGLVLFGNRVAAYFDPLTDEDAASLRRGNAAFDSARHFNEPADEARFELPDLTETGIAAEIAGLAPGSMLVECDTAGILTPPDRLLVHVYRWTGARIEFVKTVPLHELDYVAPAPQASAAEIRAGMLDAMPAAPLGRHVPHGSPLGRVVA